MRNRICNHTLRHRLPHLAVLDLKKACDMVPWALILNLVYKHLSNPLADMIRAFLTPMVYRTQGQRDNVTISTTTGVIQGDPPSPVLFNIFMDEYLRLTNTVPTALAFCIAHDVALLARSHSNLQRVLDISTTWTPASGMA